MYTGYGIPKAAFKELSLPHTSCSAESLIRYSIANPLLLQSCTLWAKMHGWNFLNRITVQDHISHPSYYSMKFSTHQATYNLFILYWFSHFWAVLPPNTLNWSNIQCSLLALNPLNWKIYYFNSYANSNSKCMETTINWSRFITTWYRRIPFTASPFLSISTFRA